MKGRILIIFLFQFAFAYGQDKTFSYVGAYQSEENLKLLAESLKKPLLVSNNKVYAIGSDCITRDFGGNATGRDDDGDENDRYKNGVANNRDKSGGVGYRDKKGRSKDRDKEGNLIDRNKAGDANQRSQDGKMGLEGTRCGISKNGILLLYTREKINAKKTTIFFDGKHFSNKYYKIIKL